MIRIVIAMIVVCLWAVSGRAQFDFERDTIVYYRGGNLLQEREDSTIRQGFLLSPDLVYSTRNNEYRGGLAASYRAKWKKVSVTGALRAGYMESGHYADDFTLETKGFLDGAMLTGGGYKDLRFRVDYRANKLLTLRLGMDRLHVGEGDRSFLLDRHASASPYAGLEFRFMKIKYNFTYQLMDESFTYGAPLLRYPKSNVSHSLEVQPFKGFKIGVFESVIYGHRDQHYNRGFEWEYLNPTIFFRPQEYSVGSTDNVLLGLYSSYHFGKNVIYAQFVLDEFNLADIKNKTRWWANKYAAQLGYKTSFNLASRAIFSRTELNLSRPYTYSHMNPNVVYGNQNRTLAHPLGGNFIELYQEFAVQYKRWRADLWGNYYLKGLDDAKLLNTSFGGDIYESYVNYAHEFGNYIGQGRQLNRFQLGLHLSYELALKGLVASRVFVEPIWQVDRLEGRSFQSIYVQVGANIPVFGERRNY